MPLRRNAPRRHRSPSLTWARTVREFDTVM
jgi:hypothetical protein